jgi:hypothetical protein
MNVADQLDHLTKLPADQLDTWWICQTCRHVEYNSGTRVCENDGEYLITLGQYFYLIRREVIPICLP